MKNNKTSKVISPTTTTLLVGAIGLILSLAIVTFTSFDDFFFATSFVFLAITLISGILLIIKILKITTKINDQPDAQTGISKLMDPKNPTSPLGALNNKR